MNKPTISIDATGLMCPLPVLKTRQAISKMGPGEWLEVTSTDPGSQHDIAAFCKQNHHVLQTVEQNKNTYRYLIQKATH